MKIIDPSASKQTSSSGTFSRVVGRLLPAANQPEVSALAVLTHSLDRVLDERYTLIKNLAIKQAQLEIPALLVGPTGLVVIYPSDAAGVFRLQGNTWEQLKNQGRRYVAARPNPVRLVQEMTGDLRMYLANQHIECQTIEPVLFLANPEIHVDAHQPDLRMVLPDTLERFISGIIHAEVVYDRPFIRSVLAALLADSKETDEGHLNDFQDEFALKDLAGVKSDRWKPFPNLPHEEPIIAQRVPFTRRQWAMIMLLIFTNIVVLTTLVVFVMSAS